MAKVTGLKSLSKILAMKRAGSQKALERGLKKGGLFLQAESMKIVPVDTGHLRSTAYTRVNRLGTRVEVLVGYTAAYAIYVHEREPVPRHGQDFNDWHAEDIAAGREHARGTNQQAKFLSRPMRRHRTFIRQLVKQELEDGRV